MIINGIIYNTNKYSIVDRQLIEIHHVEIVRWEEMAFINLRETNFCVVQQSFVLLVVL